jgi:hypothetical protein
MSAELAEAYKSQLDEEKARFEAAKKDFDAKMAADTAEKEELTKKLKESEEKAAAEEAKRKEAEDAASKIATEKHEAEVKSFFDEQTKAGIPPAALEHIRPLVAGAGEVMTFGDKQVKPMELIRSMLKEIPKVQMRQSGITDRPDIELSDSEAKAERGRNIASLANRGKPSDTVPAKS